MGLFGKKVQVELKAPISGVVVPIEQVPDEVFSSKMIGDGVAIDPQEGIIYSPVEGEIIQAFPTKHAVGIATKEGLDILIHIGVDTVKMGGEGFEMFVKIGDQVRVGDKLVTFDLQKIREKAKSTITSVLITNIDQVKSMQSTAASRVQKGDAFLTITKKK